MFKVFLYICCMAYAIKKGNKNVLDGETFKTMAQAKRTKYQIIIGGRNYKEAAPFLDTKIVKVAKKKKK